jgi:hypothetical protein
VTLDPDHLKNVVDASSLLINHVFKFISIQSPPLRLLVASALHGTI